MITNMYRLHLCIALNIVALAACGSASRHKRAPDRHSAAVQADAFEGVEANAVEGVSGQPQKRRRVHRRLKMSASRAEQCTEYGALARSIARNAGVDPLLVLAVAWVESGFDPEARSRAGALGLMQLMPRTGAAMGCTDRHDPECSLRAGSALLANLLNRHNGRVVYALCAYNAGSGGIRSAWRSGELPFNYWYAERVLAARARLARDGCRAD